MRKAWLCALLWAPAALGFDPRYRWLTLDTPHFEVHFHQGEYRFAAKVARIAVGGAELVDVFRVTNLARSLDILREHGYWVYGLDERGDLHIGDRVADYIPEYGTHGKEVITIAQVLSHRAAVPNIPASALDLESVGDRQAVLETLCNARPLVRPGKLLAYHALSGGFILGEVVQRATGRSIREVLEAEILHPLRFRWMNYGVAPEDAPLVGLNYLTGPPVLPPLSTLVKRVLVRPLPEVVEISNDPRFLSMVIPAGNVVTSANELSRFFELLRRGGELDGVRVMEERTLRRALAEQSYLDIDFSLGFPTRFSLGFMLGAKLLSLLGRDTELAFGHLGLINIMCWADPERGVSAALVTSGKAIVYPELPRFYGVMQRIASEVPKLDPGEMPFRP